MITGNFFIPEFSNEDELTANIFRYKNFYKRDTNGDAEKYPIYVVFKNNSIEFNFQGKIQTNTNDSGGFDFFYSTAPILYLPVGKENYRETQAEVKRLFKRTISIKPYFRKNQENGIYDYDYFFSTPPAPGYSQLEVFGFGPQDNWNTILWDTPVTDRENDLRCKFFRRILLDFLEDFFHSTVFQQSAKFVYIKECLVNSYILQGIYLKADYCSKELLFKQNAITEQEQLTEVRYFNALKDWMDFVIRPAHKQIFAAEKKTADIEGWFDYDEVEITAALINKSFTNTKNAGLKNEKLQVVKLGANFLIANYELFKSWYLLLYVAPFFRYLILIATLTFGFILYATADYKAMVPCGLFLCSVLFFYLARPSRKKTADVTSGRPKVAGWLTGIINLLFIVPLVIWVAIFYFLPAFSVDWSWLIACIALFLLYGFFVGAYSFKRWETVNLLLPRLLATISTTYIAIFANMDYLKRGFSVDPRTAIRYSLILLLITSFFLIYEIRRNTQVRDFQKVFWKVVNVIISGYVLSLTIGLLGMHFITEKQLMNSDFLESKISVRENIAELQTHDNKVGMWTDSVDALKTRLSTDKQNYLADDKVCLQEAVDSLKKIKNDKVFTKREHIRDSLNKYRLLESGLPSHTKVAYFFRIGSDGKAIILFPGFLILMSSFTLFSGIFLTLLFDDKAVTNPL